MLEKIASLIMCVQRSERVMLEQLIIHLKDLVVFGDHNSW